MADEDIKNIADTEEGEEEEDGFFQGFINSTSGAPYFYYADDLNKLTLALTGGQVGVFFSDAFKISLISVVGSWKFQLKAESGVALLPNGMWVYKENGTTIEVEISTGKTYGLLLVYDEENTECRIECREGATGDASDGIILATLYTTVGTSLSPTDARHIISVGSQMPQQVEVVFDTVTTEDIDALFS